MAKKRKPQFKHCRVTITTHPRAPWRVSFPVEENGVTRRKRRMFSTEQKAIDFATAHEKDIDDFGVRFGAITAEARRGFDFYRDARADLRAEGIDVPTFDELVAGAVAGLRREHEERQRSRVTVAEAVEQFLAYKQPRVGEGRLQGLRTHLKRFARTFGQAPLDSVTAAEVESWTVSLRSPRKDAGGGYPLLDPVTRNKLRKNLKEFFSFGMDDERAWCGRNPLSSIKPEKVKPTEPEAYSPEDAAKIMRTALALSSPALPSIALSMFAGLRPSETMAIDLSAIDLSNGQFRIPAGTKTGPRIATLTPACAAWLSAQKRRSGKAWPHGQERLSMENRRIFEAAGVKGIFDGYRHTFITYRTAATRDVAAVADECGNSPNIIKRHYREIVTTEAAERFFSIRPEQPAANVTNIEQGRASA